MQILGIIIEKIRKFGEKIFVKNHNRESLERFKKFWTKNIREDQNFFR
jgi:hypothetical protein